MAPHLTPIAGMTYMPHQETAIRWMMKREDNAYEFTVDQHTSFIYGGILADEMGLGKTISVVGLMLNNPVPATLVVAPLAVLGQWGDLAAKAGFSVFQLVNSSWTPLHRGGSNVLYLTNYERLVVSPGATPPIDRIVLDEAHKARNRRSATFHALLKIQANSRWALTGTPIVNKIEDLISLYMLIGYERQDHTTDKRAENKFAVDAVNALMLARRREQIPEGMPSDPIVKAIQLDFSSLEEEIFYTGIQGKITAKWKRLSSDADAGFQRLVLMLRLRQISVHPQVYIDAMRENNKNYSVGDWQFGSTKFDKVKGLLKTFPSTDGTVVFCSFIKEIELLAAELNSTHKVFTYSGGMSGDARAGQVQDAKDSVAAGNPTVMLVQIHSGGTGLNLQFMNRAIFLSPWWTAALMDQAVGRIVRVGQEKKTYVYHLRLKLEEDEQIKNIDKRMMSKVDEKRRLAEYILAKADNTL